MRVLRDCALMIELEGIQNISFSEGNAVGAHSYPGKDETASRQFSKAHVDLLRIHVIQKTI